MIGFLPIGRSSQQECYDHQPAGQFLAGISFEEDFKNASYA
jgi:hypothetical protein